MARRTADLLVAAYAVTFVATLAARRTSLLRKGPLGLLAEFLPYLAIPFPAALGWSLGGRSTGILAFLGIGASEYLRAYAHRFLPKPTPARAKSELHIVLSNVRSGTDNARRVADMALGQAADCVALLEVEP